MNARFALTILFLLSACATGPRRLALPEYLDTEDSAADAAATEGLAPTQEPAPESSPDMQASPFSVGLMLGAGMLLEGGEVMPTQLAVGSLRLLEVNGRGLNLLALGGLSQTEVSRARPAWGLGLGYQLTPERLAYAVDFGAGVLWLRDESGPAAVFGFVLTPDM